MRPAGGCCANQRQPLEMLNESGPSLRSPYGTRCAAGVRVIRLDMPLGLERQGRFRRSPTEARRRSLLLLAERTLWAFGLVGLVGWGAFQVWVAASTRHDLERFAAIGAVAAQAGPPDQSLWSRNRISAWLKAQGEPAPAPLAVLRIPKIRLEVAVLPGTDDRTLDRAVGHIEDTAQPGTDGNSGPRRAPGRLLPGTEGYRPG